MIDSTCCETCGNRIDVEDLFCANCGREAPDRKGALPTREGSDVHSFKCRNCGAAVTYDAKVQALRCSFCSSTFLDKLQSPARRIVAEKVVPFSLERAEAYGQFREWLTGSFWRPGDIGSRAALEKMDNLFLPFWNFDAETHSYWTADTNRTPPGARADWCPVTDELRGRHAGVLIPASAGVPRNLLQSVCQFDLASEAGFAPERIGDAGVEEFGLTRRRSRPLAREALHQLEAERCVPCIPGTSHRNLHVNMLVKNADSYSLLLPFWLLAYRYRKRVYQIVINGQSGATAGQAPLSWIKILAVLIGIVAVIALVVLLTR